MMIKPLKDAIAFLTNNALNVAIAPNLFNWKAAAMLHASTTAGVAAVVVTIKPCVGGNGMLIPRAIRIMMSTHDFHLTGRPMYACTISCAPRSPLRCSNLYGVTLARTRRPRKCAKSFAKQTRVPGSCKNAVKTANPSRELGGVYAFSRCLTRFPTSALRCVLSGVVETRLEGWDIPGGVLSRSGVKTAV